MPQRPNQRQKLLKLLRENSGQWVGLPRILDLRISQYSARVHELRKMGYRIENKTKHCNGQVWSWFRLVEEGQAKLFQSEQRAGHFLEPELSRRC
jgi:hypothetical protein